jgi:DHA3 family macrolide efflux protein-like MFS transporter
METTKLNQSLNKWKKRFFMIWSGQAVSQLGSRLVGFAFVWHLTSTYHSATILSIATLVSILPDVIISPIAGALIDRWNRKKVMIVTDILTAVLTLVLALLFAFTDVQIWQIYLVMFLRATFGAFQWPAMLTSTSLMVPKEQLARISGLNQTLAGAMGILAPPLGAFLVALLPMWGVLSIDIVTALVAVIPLLFFHIPQPDVKLIEKDANGKNKSTLWKDLAEGFKYVVTLPGLLAVILSAMVINFLVSPAFSLLPLMVTDYFKKGAIELGIIESIFSLGFLAGGLILSIWGGFKNRLVTTFFFLIIMGFCIAMFGLVPNSNFYLAMGVLALVGISNPLVNGPLHAALQARVDPDKQGRVFTLLTAGATLAMPIGLAVAGPLSDAVGVQIWFIIGGIVCVVMALLMMTNKKVMQLGKDIPPTPPREEPAPVSLS